jgi:hypothetical protein
MMSIWYTAQQPALFPPVYLMERMARVHHWVILEEAQFDRDNVQFKLTNVAGFDERTVNTNRIGKTIRGLRVCFDELQVVDPEPFSRKLLLALQMNYGRCDGYKSIKPWLTDLLFEVSRRSAVNDICEYTLGALEHLLVLGTSIQRSLRIVPKRPVEPTAWMASFCRQLHATDYIQGRKASEAYFLKGPFEDANCRTWGQVYDIFYETIGDRPVDARISILDALCVLGVEGTRKLLKVDQGKGDIGTAIELTRG